MEKTIQLDSKESAMVAAIDQERTNALAQVGALSLDMEQARKNLDSAAERQRSFIRQALAIRGIDRFDNARVQNGALHVSMPEEMPAPSGLSQDITKMVERVNGAPDVAKE